MRKFIASSNEKGDCHFIIYILLVQNSVAYITTFFHKYTVDRFGGNPAVFTPS